jgi:hypothetical protein
MAIMDTILTTPADVKGLKAAGASIETQLDAAFSNLLFFARYNWHYVASGRTGGQDLLDGTGDRAPCGGIATALKLVFMNGLGLTDDDVEYIRITSYVWTGPEYLCFDPKVIGNLRWLDDTDYRNGCIFNEHYYLKAQGKYYDPCLSTAYLTRDQSVKEEFGGLKSKSIGPRTRKLLLTGDGHGILYMPSEVVVGFNGAYAMFELTRKNLEKGLGKTEYKAEMDYRGGNNPFAQFVATLN